MWTSGPRVNSWPRCFPIRPFVERECCQAPARLAPGVICAQAQAVLDVLTAQWRQQYATDYPADQRWSLRVESAQESLTGNVRPTLLILLAAEQPLLAAMASRACCCALIGTWRGIRIAPALGATPLRLARQILTESALIAIAGGFVALIALRLARPLLALMPRDIPRSVEIGADWRLIVIALAASVVTGLAVGVIPRCTRRALSRMSN